MIRTRMFPAASLTVVLLGLGQLASADSYSIVLKGKVVTEDGSPPPVEVAILRQCSDIQGSAPGPLANKKTGEYIWRMDIDYSACRECYIYAEHKGWTSTRIEVQSLDINKPVQELPNLVIRESVVDPYQLVLPEGSTPGKAKSEWNAAMKALDAHNYDETARRLQNAVAAVPKFAAGWHALGVLAERSNKQAEAKDDYEKAIAADPKLLAPYVTLTRLQLKMKDWDGASKAADSLIKADSKHLFPEAYVHLAVARYHLKDLAGAEMAVREEMRLDPKGTKVRRAEYVLGRILEAKGDSAGAAEHMAKYLQLDPNAPDIVQVKAHADNLGKPTANLIEPELEVL